MFWTEGERRCARQINDEVLLLLAVVLVLVLVLVLLVIGGGGGGGGGDAGVGGVDSCCHINSKIESVVTGRAGSNNSGVENYVTKNM